MWIGFPVWYDDNNYFQGTGSHSFTVDSEDSEVPDKKNKSPKINLGLERGLKEDQNLICTPLLLIAKKDFVISHNEYVKKIKAGDDISDVPVLYHENLRTEGVL